MRDSMMILCERARVTWGCRGREKCVQSFAAMNFVQGGSGIKYFIGKDWKRGWSERHARGHLRFLKIYIEVFIHCQSC